MNRTLQNLVRGIFSKHDVQGEKVRRYSSVEALEQRVFLSGTVLASVMHGSLTIRGDSAANAIVLDQVGLTAGQIRVTGANGTMINGQAGPLVLSGVTAGAHIGMGTGADSLALSNLSVSGNLTINSHDGSDALSLNNVQVAGNLFVQNLSSHASTTTIVNATVGKSLTLLPGWGNETVALQSVQVHGGAYYASGAGADILTVDNSTFQGPVQVSTGRGNDVVDIASHGDPLGLSTVFHSTVTIKTGAGNDILQLGIAGQSGNNATFDRKAFFGGGPNFDIIRNLNSTYGKKRFFIENFESTQPAPDTTAPTVSSTAPANNATDVAPNQGISATFSEPMNPSTIIGANVTVQTAAGVPVLGTVAYVGTTMIFTPTGDLAPNTTFTATITTGATDLAGNALASNYTWSFTTGAAPDTTDPTVSSTTPANNATGVSLNSGISATFSEAMNPLTITSANVAVTSSGSMPVTGSVAYVGTTMTFTPTIQLPPNSTITVTIATGATDIAGNPLANNYVWSFTTGATADTTAPTVSSTAPANSATGVALNQKIAATFSKSMNPLTINTADVTVSGPGSAPVSGTVSYVGTTMTFAPASPLTAGAVYTATITTGATDLAGNPLAANYVWSFTTGATADTTDPTVTSTTPTNLQTNVPLNQTVAATFSEAIDPLTVAGNFSLTGSGNTSVSGTVNYDSASDTATFTPSSNLLGNATYTAKITGGTNGAKDLAGNPLAQDYVWSFTTGATPDLTPPTVTSTGPANLQTNVALNKTVAATFSESIDPQTIAANYKVTGPMNAAVMGTVSYDAPNDIATFTPSSNFAPNTTYTATISGGANGVKDLAGNALVNNDVWSFTTGTQVAQAPINLGSAGSFAILATAAISGTGLTQINGDVGLNPGSAQGIPPSEVNGMIQVDNNAVIKAQSDLLAAYNDAVSRTVTSQVLPGNMGGLTFTPGLYTNSTSVLIQGAGPNNNVTLDAQGDPNAVFIFKMGSTLTTGPGAQVILTGGAKASNIFWQVGTSATLNTTTIFYGSILASVTITVDDGSVVDGRLLAGSNSDGSVTVNGSTVTVPAT